ncbi:MAG: ABC transporter permease [Syntrophomonas sp.]
MKFMLLNPILEKELRSRMRSWKSSLVISLYLGLLGIIILGYYWMEQKNDWYNGFGPDVGPQIFILLAIVQLLLLSLVTPALTAGVINGERERQTFDLLICTRLSAASIVLHKFLASIGFTVLLIIASLPVFGIVYFFGGVLFSDIGQVFLVYIVTAVTFGVIGIFCSVLFKRTQISMVVSYLAVLFFLLGTLILALFVRGIQTQAYPVSAASYISSLSPLVALMSIFPNQSQGISFFNNFLNISPTIAGTAKALIPWKLNFIINGIVSLLLLFITIIMVDPVGRFSWLRRNKGHEQLPRPLPDEERAISD